MIRVVSRAKLARVDGPRRLLALAARTLRAFVPALARPDDDFAARWLADGELAAFLAMDPRDRDHACRVARRMLARHPRAEPVWVRAALLHDVGKSLAPYRPWERIAAHLARHLARGGTSAGGRAEGVPARDGGWARATARDRVHAEVGAQLLAAAGADARVVALVAHHHAPEPDDAGATALAEADAAADADVGWLPANAAARAGARR